MLTAFCISLSGTLLLFLTNPCVETTKVLIVEVLSQKASSRYCKP